MNQQSPYLIVLCNQLETQLGFKIKNIANAEKGKKCLLNDIF